MATADPDRPECDASTAHEAHHDFGGAASLSTTVIEAVAAAEGVDPTECDLRLYDTVDLEALDALFERGPRDDHLQFEFGVRDFVVTVHGGGRVAVYDRR